MTFVESTIIKNFKNYHIAEFRFGSFNVIKGPNGSGKTNLIEAVYLSINAHPFLKKLKHLPNQQDKSIIVSSRVKKNKETNITHVEIKGSRKTAKINAKPSTIKQFKEKFPSVIFSFRTFVEFDRKRYLFSLLDQNSFIHDKSIMDYIISYHRVLKQKRAILKTYKIDRKLLTIKNEELIALMEKISRKREASAVEINSSLEKISTQLLSKKASLKYHINSITKEILEREMEQRRILATLNRDHLSVRLNEHNVHEFASLGEKKAVLFSIINAIIENYGSSKPVVLIDDLEGDLDSNLKRRMLGIIESLNTQVFITSLEYEPSNGSIIKLEGKH